MSRTLLVSRQDEVEVFAVVDGIEDWENSTSGIPNCCSALARVTCKASSPLFDSIAIGTALTDVLDVMPEHHLVEDLSTLHSHEAVVHFGLAEWLQWLWFSAFWLIAVESWTRHSSLLRRRRLCCRLCIALRRR